LFGSLRDKDGTDGTAAADELLNYDSATSCDEPPKELMPPRRMVLAGISTSGKSLLFKQIKLIYNNNNIDNVDANNISFNLDKMYEPPGTLSCDTYYFYFFWLRLQ